MDFNVLWVSKCEYPVKHVVKLNHHAYYQLIFVLNGDGNISADCVEYKTKVNQLFLIKPYVWHSISALSTKSLTTVEFKFYCNDSDTEYVLTSLPGYIENVGLNVRSLMLNVVQELKNQETYHEEMLKLFFTQLIYRLSRLHTGRCVTQGIMPEEREDAVDIRKYKPLKIVIDYMKQNYSRNDITLNYLANMVHLNSVYFCTMFKEKYGVNPINYLQNIRLENAKALLTNTDESITDIAGKSGFQSVHYFSRFFKQHEGISPNVFRSRNSGFIYKDFDGNITDFS